MTKPDLSTRSVASLTEAELIDEAARIYDMPRDVCRRAGVEHLRRVLYAADRFGFDGKADKRKGD